MTGIHSEILCFIIGTTCGFPLGCYYVSECVQRGELSKEKGQLYATAFNQFSPVFLVSYVATAMLDMKVTKTLAILYASHLLLFIPLSIMIGHKQQTFLTTQHDPGPKQKNPSLIIMLDHAIIKSSETLVKIGGYMLVCSLLRTMLQKFISNQMILVLLAGLLETTSGVAFLNQSCASYHLMRMLGLGFTAFGGICGFLQVSSPLESAGLNKKFYICFKIVAGILASLLYLPTFFMDAY
ncbi:MAG: hypothetical protein ACI39H_05805 [Lachnospiraceae bacterium]